MADFWSRQWRQFKENKTLLFPRMRVHIIFLLIINIFFLIAMSTNNIIHDSQVLFNFDENGERISLVLHSMRIVSFFCFYLAILLALLMIRNITKLSIMSRKQELFILNAVGAQRKEIKEEFYAESVIIGIVSVVASLFMISLLYALFYLNKDHILGWMAPSVEVSVPFVLLFFSLNIVGSILIELSNVKKTVNKILANNI